MHSNVRHQYPPQQSRPRPNFISTGQQQTNLNNENSFQNLINNICAEICENDDTIAQLQCFVEDIERALKTVSDKIMEQCKLNNITVIPQLPENVKLNNPEQSNEDPSESFR